MLEKLLELIFDIMWMYAKQSNGYDPVGDINSVE